MGVCSPQGLCRAGFGELYAAQSQTRTPPALPGHPLGATDTEQMPPLILYPLLLQPASLSPTACSIFPPLAHCQSMKSEINLWH